jgi:Ni/Co efflux regulator RcnB
MSKLLIILAAAAFGLAATPAEAQVTGKANEAAAKAKSEAEKKGKPAPARKKRKVRSGEKRDGR